MKDINTEVITIAPVYSFVISADPLTGKGRLLESPELSINSNSVFLQCTISYLDDNGNKIVSERLRPYSCRLAANNSATGAWINPTTGQEVTPILDEDVNSPTYNKMVVPDDAVLMYDYFISKVTGSDSVVIAAIVESFVTTADLDNKFDI